MGWYQASVNAQSVKFERLNQYLGMLPQLVTSLANTAVLMLGVWLTIRGQFTAGMILAFQGFLSSFTTPATTLISAGQTLQEMRTEMERVEDVMAYPTDVVYESEKEIEAKHDPEAQPYDKLSGAVEMRDVTFGYSRLAIR